MRSKKTAEQIKREGFCSYIQQYRKLSIFRVEMNMHNNDNMIIKESANKYKADESRM
jgi:hypothetical protein